MAVINNSAIRWIDWNIDSTESKAFSKSNNFNDYV